MSMSRHLSEDSDLDEYAGIDPEEREITNEWIANILTAYYNRPGTTDDGNKIDANTLKIVKDKLQSGPTLSNIFTLNVTYQQKCDKLTEGSDDEKRTKELFLVVKCLPDDPGTRLFVMEAGIDDRERQFYNQIIPDMKEFLKNHLPPGTPKMTISVPECYYPLKSSDITSAPSVILVLENLKPKGYYARSFADGLTLNEVTAALSMIAQFHATSLAMKIERKRNMNEMYPFLFQIDQASDSLQTMLERGMNQLGMFLERKPNLMGIFRLILNIRVKTKDIVKQLLNPREPICVLTHTDFWCNNLLFRQENGQTDCSILDWQMTAYSQPTNDVALLITSSLPAELRRKHRNSLLDHYWKCFTEYSKILKVDVEGTLKYRKEIFLNDYRTSQLLALLLCIGSIDIALGNPATEERLVCLLQDLKSDGILNGD